MDPVFRLKSVCWFASFIVIVFAATYGGTYVDFPLSEPKAKSIYGDQSQQWGWCFAVDGCDDKPCSGSIRESNPVLSNCGEGREGMAAFECNGVMGNEYCMQSVADDHPCFQKYYCKVYYSDQDYYCDRGVDWPAVTTLAYDKGDCSF